MSTTRIYRKNTCIISEFRLEDRLNTLAEDRARGKAPGGNRVAANALAHEIGRLVMAMPMSEKLRTAAGKEGAAGEDCIWVGGFGWESAEPYTHTTEVPVPYAWLTAHDPDVVDEYEAYEVSAKKAAANGRAMWECYVEGLDPEIATNDFKITSFPMKAGCTPDLENLAFAPPHAQWNVQGARAVIKGAAALDAADWPEVTEENKASFRFFKVEVELP